MKYSEALWRTGVQTWNPVDLIGGLLFKVIGR